MLGAETIDRIAHFHSDDAPVLSLYLTVPVDPREAGRAESELHALLKPVRELGDSDQLDHYAKKSLREDIGKMLDLTRTLAARRGRSLAVFACSHHRFYEEMVLPRRVRDRATVDATPYVRPMLAVLDEAHRYVAVVVERRDAWLFEYFMGELEDAEQRQGRALRDRNHAGWYGLQEHTVHKKAELLARQHFRETAEAVARLVQRSGAELLVVGGHEETVAEFLPFLPHQLQGRVAGTFVIDTDTVTPARVRKRIEGVVDAYERAEEARMVAQALERVAAGGFGAVGVQWCLLAVDEKAVQLLLVDDEVEVAGLACDNCGWVGLAVDETGTCPVCAHRVHATADVIDEMAVGVIDAGGTVEHVYADTPLHEHQVAAMLRFPVRAPTATA
ncbi:MAG: hypothetical protein JWM47_2298 [Acidimicrobiales bacterium]|nr:hypothetical protein [Acidimicrobiales bacterium]